MKTKVYLVLVIVSLILLISCKNNQLEGPVKIGVMAAFTGKFADIGEDFRNGLEVALEKINDDRRIIELVYEDHAADPKVAVQAFVTG